MSKFFIGGLLGAVLLVSGAQAQPAGYIPDYNYLTVTDQEFCETLSPAVYSYIALYPTEAVGIYNAVQPYYERLDEKGQSRTSWLVAVVIHAAEHSAEFNNMSVGKQLEFHDFAAVECFKSVSDEV